MKSINERAKRVVEGWALNDANDPHARESLEGRIAAGMLELARDQREACAEAVAKLPNANVYNRPETVSKSVALGAIRSTQIEGE